MRKSILGLALVAALSSSLAWGQAQNALTPAFSWQSAFGSCSDGSSVLWRTATGFSCGATIPQRATVTIGSGGSATWSFAAPFASNPIVVCTANNTSTTTAYIVNISAITTSSASLSLFSTQPPALTGNILSLANIMVGNPVAPSTSAVSGGTVNCIAALPTQ